MRGAGLPPSPPLAFLLLLLLLLPLPAGSAVPAAAGATRGGEYWRPSAGASTTWLGSTGARQQGHSGFSAGWHGWQGGRWRPRQATAAAAAAAVAGALAPEIALTQEELHGACRVENVAAGQRQRALALSFLGAPRQRVQTEGAALRFVRRHAVVAVKFSRRPTAGGTRQKACGPLPRQRTEPMDAMTVQSTNPECASRSETPGHKACRPPPPPRPVTFSPPPAPCPSPLACSYSRATGQQHRTQANSSGSGSTSNMSWRM